MKKFLSLLCVITIFFTLFSITNVNVSAASTSLKVSSDNVEIGEQVSVTVVLQNDTEMIDATCVIYYDQEILKYDSGDASGGAGVLKFVSDKSASSYTISLKFTSIAVGEASIEVKDCVCTYLGDGEAKELPFDGKSTEVKVYDKILSSNADLKKLSLSKGTLAPKFSASVTSYIATVDYDVTKCTIYATAADSKALNIKGSGVKTLKVGDNTFVVTVTAQSGITKDYTIVIKRQQKVEDTTSEPTDTETPENPYLAVIDDQNYIIATDISSVKMLSGFTATVVDYNGVQVGAAVDSENNYTIFYLSAEGTSTLTPYLYNVTDNSFVKLNYITQGSYDYLLVDFPQEYEFPKGFSASNVTIGENTYDCYISDATGMDDFSFFYCYVNGEYGIYRYDSRENILQRSPDVQLVLSEVPNKQNDTVVDKFASLSTNSKVILIAIIVIIIAVITLFVLFIISLFKKVDTLEAEINEDFNFNETEIEDETQEDIEETEDEDF